MTLPRHHQSPTATGVWEAAGLAVLASVLFVALAVAWTFTPTSPSDPLEYVGAALAPQEGFPYLDRVALWLWLRAFALLPIPLEYIGPVATLTQTVLILGVGVYWLARKFGPLPGALFGGLYMLSPMVLGIATYTYPIQLMTLCLLGVALANTRSPRAGTMLGSGAGLALAALSKVQAGGAAIVLALRIARAPNGLRWLALLALGGVVTLGLVTGLLIVLDGPSQPMRIVETFFFGGAGATQFSGVATGGIPPFHYYLAEPTAVLAVIGAVIPWIWHRARELRIFAAFAIGQTVFLVAIYVITQRGGALISNYSFDAVVFGLIAFSGAAGLFAQRRVSRPVPYLVIVGCYAVVEVLARVENQAAQFYPQFAPKLLSALSLDWMAYLLLAPFAALLVWLATRLWPSRGGLAGPALVTAVAIVLGLAVLYAGKGPAYGAYHRNWSMPYHQLAHRIMAETEPVCLDIRMGNATAEAANWRMDWLLSKLYLRPGSFAGEIGAGCGVVYTDQLENLDTTDGLGEFQYAMTRRDMTTLDMQHFTLGSGSP